MQQSLTNVTQEFVDHLLDNDLLEIEGGTGG